MTQGEAVAKIRQSYPFVDLVFGPQDIYRLPELLYHRLTDTRACMRLVKMTPWLRAFPSTGPENTGTGHDHHGCNNFCTIALSPHTRQGTQPADGRHPLGSQGSGGERLQEIMLLGQNAIPMELTCKKWIRTARFFGSAGASRPRSGYLPIRFMTSHPKDLSPSCWIRSPAIRRSNHTSPAPAIRQ
jgi:tRNA-2-methylthio-N6-dimethylallyladenosine synthase